MIRTGIQLRIRRPEKGPGGLVNWTRWELIIYRIFFTTKILAKKIHLPDFYAIFFGLFFDFWAIFFKFLSNFCAIFLRLFYLKLHTIFFALFFLLLCHFLLFFKPFFCAILFQIPYNFFRAIFWLLRHFLWFFNAIFCAIFLFLRHFL